MAALTAHAESQGVRCVLRETSGYRQFLDQLTAGILDTTEKHVDGTEKYSVPAAARATFGTMQGAWVGEQIRKQDAEGWGGWGGEEGGEKTAQSNWWS
jgi:hypothetical protein